MTNRVRTTRRLEVWLKDTSVAMFVLNNQRRLVFFNVGCESLTGWTPADVMGQVCDYVSESDPNQPGALLACLAPPANVWQGMTVVARNLLTRRNHEPLPCEIHYYPLTDLEQKVQAVLGVIQQAVESPKSESLPVSQRLHMELAALRHAIRQQYGESSLVAASPPMRRLTKQIKLAQQSNFPILLIGEPGSGREYLARLIHQSSEFGQQVFVPLDCQSLSAEHLEATLKRMLQARLENALQPGTVYLDGIESLPRDLQRLVLDLIESNLPTKIRVIAAATRPIERLVEDDQFLSELHLALSSLTLVIPPLRNRSEDIEPLAQFFLEELNRGEVKQINGFHEDVLRQFHRYDWPGNVRELQAVVREARQACADPIIEKSDLPFSFRVGVDRQSIGPVIRRQQQPLDTLLLQVEREQIEAALADAGQNKAKAADLLGITRPRLYRRMEILGIADSEPGSPDNSAEPT